VVPATPQEPATPTEPPQWQFHPPSENVPIAHWPKIPNFAFAEVEGFAAPVLPNFDTPDGALLLSGEPFNRARVTQNVPLPRETPWPRLSELPVQNAAITLPVPEQSLFEVPSDARAAFEPSPPPRRAEMTAEREAEGRSKQASTETSRSDRVAAKHGRGAKARLARGGRQTTRVAHGGRAAPKHQAHAGKPARKPVHLASLKKR
jgi:peptidoglycan-N-acetylglucosamine deacetylase